MLYPPSALCYTKSAENIAINNTINRGTSRDIIMSPQDIQMTDRKIAVIVTKEHRDDWQKGILRWLSQRSIVINITKEKCDGRHKGTTRWMSQRNVTMPQRDIAMSPPQPRAKQHMARTLCAKFVALPSSYSGHSLHYVVLILIAPNFTKTVEGTIRTFWRRRQCFLIFFL